MVTKASTSHSKSPSKKSTLPSPSTSSCDICGRVIASRGALANHRKACAFKQVLKADRARLKAKRLAARSKPKASPPPQWRVPNPWEPEDSPSSMPPIGSTRTKVHPHSKHAPTATQELQSRSSRTHDMTPWYPFSTRTDFEFARIVVGTMSKEDMTTLLEIVRRCVNKEDSITLSTCDDMEKTWAAAGNLVPPACFHCCKPHLGPERL